MSPPDFPVQSGSIALVGNPNVGKSVIFGYLTGTYVTVSNYPGTTVELTRGKFSFRGKSYELIDTPGTNNLIPSSEDEVVTRDILIFNRPEYVIQVIDAKNLKRGLLLSLQLAELGIPYMIVLNMVDEARQRGIHIDSTRLSEIMGVPVLSSVATRRRGLGNIKAVLTGLRPPAEFSPYSDHFVAAFEQIESLLPDSEPGKRGLATLVLAGDKTLSSWLRSRIPENHLVEIEHLIAGMQEEYSETLRNIITRQRLNQATRISDTVVQQISPQESVLSVKAGNLLMHHIWGLVGVLLVLFGMYEFVGVFGAGTLVDLFQVQFFDGFLTPLLRSVGSQLLPVQWIYDLFLGEYGLLSMALSYSIAIVLPIVGTFFLAFGILEDSGYLPRLAVMVNRVFGFMGLNGKAVLPMVLGLGCDTMATLTTRILDTRKERLIVTLLLALGVPCSAQLGVILGMLGGLSLGATVLWLSVVLGVLVLVGYISSKIIHGDHSNFILEIPPLRIPRISNILIKTVARIEWYIREAVPLFFLGTFVLFILDKVKLLSIVQRGMAPVVQGFLNLPAEASTAFLVGFLRRDYGAAGLYNMALNGQLDHTQILVSLIAITLFMPCIANFFIIIKEQGLRTALLMGAFILPFSILVAGAFNYIVRMLGLFS